MSVPAQVFAPEGSGASVPLPGASRFYARNGDVFMVSAWGGYFLTRGDEQRMLALWNEPTGDLITDTTRAALADELEAAMAEAERQLQHRQAA